MDPLRVTPSRHRTRDRLYVHRSDGTTLAWYDRDSGHVSLLDSASRDAVLHSLTPFLAGPVTVGPPPAPTPPTSPASPSTPMTTSPPTAPASPSSSPWTARPTVVPPPACAPTPAAAP
ncbi:hypothetical protein B0E37_00439 [Streptomyces sp. MH192]|nr:hypothetical protein [Streptomyces sp. MH192]